jgi:hypothetical protein
MTCKSIPRYIWSDSTEFLGIPINQLEGYTLSRRLYFETKNTESLQNGGYI